MVFIPLMMFLNSLHYETEFELEDFEVGGIRVIKSMVWNSVQLKKLPVPSSYASCIFKNIPAEKI